MLFNSYSFLFGFLPVALAGFFYLAHHFSRRTALIWLVAASVFFYASWQPGYTVLLAASIAINFSLSRLLDRTDRHRRLVVSAGIAANIVVLFYYKSIIAGFFSDGPVYSSAFSTTEKILIPLAISFITFQQIAFLVDSYRSRLKRGSFWEYALFITFFPQLIMGPIVHYRELVPQTQRPGFLRWNSHNFALGMAIFIVGLFKKTVLADGIAPFVNEVYALAHSGMPVGAVDAWSAAIGFQFQIYFDFSGYADMAVGLGRLFNLHLPINFDSPYRAVDRFDLWRRWHISFATFMRQYVYFPLARLRRFGLAQHGALLLTTFLSGLWHGIGLTFLLWGALQGLIMLASHAVKTAKRRFGFRERNASALRLRGRILLTFVITTLLGVIFRAKDLNTIYNMLSSMAWQQGWGLPHRLSTLLETCCGWRSLFADDASHRLAATDLFYLYFMAAVIWGLPNTQSFFADFWRGLDQRASRPPVTTPSLLPFMDRLRFQPRFIWALYLALLLLVSLLNMDGSSRFIYYQF